MDIYGPVLLSLQASFIALLFFLPLAIPVSWLFARKEFRGKSIVEVIVIAPLVLPPLVTGYLLLLLFSPSSPVGSFLSNIFGLQIPFTILGAGLAGGIVAFPLMVRTLQQRFESLDDRLEMTARTLGATPLESFFSITLPQAIPGIVAAGLIGFARCFGEFGATVILAGNIPGRTQTVPSAIFSALNIPGQDDHAFVFIIISIIISVLAVLLTYFITRKGGKRR